MARVKHPRKGEYNNKIENNWSIALRGLATYVTRRRLQLCQ